MADQNKIERRLVHSLALSHFNQSKPVLTLAEFKRQLAERTTKEDTLVMGSEVYTRQLSLYRYYREVIVQQETRRAEEQRYRDWGW